MEKMTIGRKQLAMLTWVKRSHGGTAAEASTFFQICFRTGQSVLNALVRKEMVRKHRDSKHVNHFYLTEYGQRVQEKLGVGLDNLQAEELRGFYD